MEDSTKMTIEFLRARLLSERSVSRAARQRADQQDKRVMELEEKLGFVSIQRKKAERAATEVLSILETQGISELSEEIDSSSDSSEEEAGLCHKELKEYESSTASRLERSEVEIELSGSEPEISNSHGKNLSWKSRSKSPDYGENQISKELRLRQRQGSFFSTLQSSPKRRFGKSCRKIKPRDIGSEADSEKYKCGVECSSNCDSHDEYRDNCNEQSGGDKVMERVLDHQAELIGQFQAEEIAQRDWEDKFNNNVPSVDHESVGKSSSTAATNSVAKEFKLAEDYYTSAEEMSGTEVPLDKTLSTSENYTSDTTFSNNLASRDPTSAPVQALLNSPGNDMVGTESKDIHGMIRNKLQNEVVHHSDYASKSKSHPSSIPLGKNQTETSNKLGGVLEALQSAKLSLNQELNNLSSSDENTPTMLTAALNIDIPIDSASLFRLPTDTFPEELLSMSKFSDRELFLHTNRPTTTYFERGSRNVR